MGIIRRKLQVRPNHLGFLYNRHQFEQQLKPGIYHYFDPFYRLKVYSIPITKRLLDVTNQEVLTSDGIAFRFSYFVLYTITDGEKFMSSFELEDRMITPLVRADQLLFNLTQGYVKGHVASLSSEEVYEQRSLFENLQQEQIQALVAEYGITIQDIQLRDVFFPKNIQNLFARRLEAKIRAQADLENARTTVAAARALKNASNLMKGDNTLMFFQFLETISKIADKGKHTFMIGDFPQSTNGVSVKNDSSDQV